MTMTKNEKPVSEAGQLRREVISDEVLDQLLASTSERGITLTGEGGLLPELLKAVLERGMQAELTDHLGYARHDPAGRGSGNSRNGTTSKTLDTEVGPIELERPRDRNGSFVSRLVPTGQRRLGGLEDQIISLYAGGMDDPRHPAPLGCDAGHRAVSRDHQQRYRGRRRRSRRMADTPPGAFYPVIYLDALVVKVRDQNRVVNRHAHIAVGVDTEGIKHVLGIWVQATEGAKFWASVCAQLANRGLSDVLIVCCDGLTGFPEAIEATWPAAMVQTCVVHLIRASMRFVAYADRKPVAAALKPIYTVIDEEQALTALAAFAASPLGRQYPAAVATWEHAWDRFIPFLDFGPATRKVIYTTNSIESLNYQLRKIIKNHGQFPNDAAVVKLLWLAIRNIEDKRARQRAKEAGTPKGQPRKAPPRLVEGSTVQGWTKALNELALRYPERFPTT
ncbi:IS256 family transposase [Tessaracoccus caeni]|uniref:IS256 family transposase n=1 Tax=Tessaracoccus caeni TaxID=3031239 RepID=UPI0023DA30DF|nr:IS256 family transposase [Tessaracoccus caeni]MDF1490279.1 IS256 family transposase [Tessaracoccus caeni]